EERWERSKSAFTPKQEPRLKKARARYPELGIVREMQTSLSETMYSLFPGSPSFKTCFPTANFCSRQTSVTRASSPSSRSWKIAACFNRLRFTARSYDAPEGGASETVGDAGGSAYRPSPSARGAVSIRARCGLAAGDRGCGRRVGFLRRDAGASLRRVAHGG